MRALSRAISWQIFKRVTNRYVDFSYHGYQLRCYPDSRSASSALYFGCYPDYNCMKFMERYLRPEDGYVDVGANVGIYTLLAASIVGQKGRIDAFEPGSKALIRLKENINSNGLNFVKVHSTVVGATTGKVGFTVGGVEDTLEHIVPSTDTASRKQWVSSISLDDAVGNNLYAMGKMDIEGAELFVLQGAQKMLKKTSPPAWQLELNGCSNNYGISSHEIIKWLGAHKYDVALYDADAHALMFTLKPWVYGANDILAISRTKREFVLNRLRGYEGVEFQVFDDEIKDAAL